MSKESAFDGALDALRRHVVQEGLKPGDVLPPVAELARSFGVSQATLREALRAWEAAGILTIRHGVGAFIQANNYAPLLENLSISALFARDQARHMFQLREALELGVLPQVLEQLNSETLDKLDAMVEEMPHADDGQDVEFRFHARLCGLLGNPLIDGLYELTWLSLQQERESGILSVRPRLRYALHIELVEALRMRDLAAAQGALRRYLALAMGHMAGA